MIKEGGTGGGVHAGREHQEQGEYGGENEPAVVDAPENTDEYRSAPSGRSAPRSFPQLALSIQEADSFLLKAL